MAFIRNVEDFVCAHCKAMVKGTGYTNHCPKCLWSKHVDIEPGDRAEQCGGIMEPILLEGSTPSYRIVHKCIQCGVTRRIDVAANDAPDAIVAQSGKKQM